MCKLRASVLTQPTTQRVCPGSAPSDPGHFFGAALSVARHATGRFFDTKLDVAAMARLNRKTKPAKG
jgi:hypothetical protein